MISLLVIILKNALLGCKMPGMQCTKSIVVNYLLDLIY